MAKNEREEERNQRSKKKKKKKYCSTRWKRVDGVDYARVSRWNYLQGWISLSALEFSRVKERREEKIREWNWRDTYLPFFFFNSVIFLARAHPLSFWISGENFQRMGRIELNSNQEAKLMCLANNDAGNRVFHGMEFRKEDFSRGYIICSDREGCFLSRTSWNSRWWD